MGYHVTKIKKAPPFTLEKIREEVEEALDAEKQGVDIMVLVELSDIYLALRQFLQAAHPGFKMNDLKRMADCTESAFKDGTRK